MIKTLSTALPIAFLFAMLGSAPTAHAQTQARKQTPPKPPASVAAKTTGKGLPADSVLLAITNRGRAINDYDFAAWHGSDALAATKVDANQVTHYIARSTANGWVVGFGHLNDARDKFLLVAEATSGGNASENAGFTATAKANTVVDTGYYKRAALAIDVAKEAFGKVDRPYNTAVLPASKGQLWVYLMPAQVTSNVWPLGADVRYLISADGRTIISKRQLHNTIIDFSPTKIAAVNGGQVVVSMHSAVLDDVPEDTDVFHVLNRYPHVPEMIVTKSFVFRVEVDGTVKCLGRAEDVIKK